MRNTTGCICPKTWDTVTVQNYGTDLEAWQSTRCEVENAVSLSDIDRRHLITRHRRAAVLQSYTQRQHPSLHQLNCIREAEVSETHG